MTTEDKTGDKLAESIRRTKGGGAAKTGGEAAANTTPRRRRSASKGDKTTVQLPAATKQATSSDAYQSSGRVWPD